MMEDPPQNGRHSHAKKGDLLKADKMGRLNRLLVNAICEGLEFGEVILHFIELNSSLKRDEIAYNPQAFAREMERIFGDASSIMLETIVRKLYASLGMKIKEGKRQSFRESIMEAAKNILN